MIAFKIFYDYLNSFYYFSVSMFNSVSHIFLIYSVDYTSKYNTVQTKKKY